MAVNLHPRRLTTAVNLHPRHPTATITITRMVDIFPPGCTKPPGGCHIRKDTVCVLVITKNLLLGDLLENLMTNLFDPRTQQILRLNPNDLSKRINQYQPDVVLLEEGLMGELSLWSRQQLYNGRIRIILVHPYENWVQVWGQFPITLTQIADFTALFENISPIPRR